MTLKKFKINFCLLKDEIESTQKSSCALHKKRSL
jgi:hypothetical protein